MSITGYNETIKSICSKPKEVKQMPARDGSGPMGQGPMTGRAMGYCTGNRATYNRFTFGRGLGLGRGMGYGRGMGLRRGYGQYYNDLGPLGYKSEKDFLAEQKEFLKQRLDIINSQLEDLVEDSK